MIGARLASSKQYILNFVTAHPKVTTLLATVGITISFSLIGRISLEDSHLAFASPTIPLEKFPVDHIPKDTLATLNGVSCSGCVDLPPGK